MKLTVPYTSTANPANCGTDPGQTTLSHPSAKLPIQIPSVRHVSIVLLAVALTRLVTDSPKKLNPAMENMIKKEARRTEEVSSERGGMIVRGMEGNAARMGRARRIESVPKKPS